MPTPEGRSSWSTSVGPSHPMWETTGLLVLCFPLKYLWVCSQSTQCLQPTEGPAAARGCLPSPSQRDLVSRLGNAQACQGLLMPGGMASHVLVFTKPFSAITSMFSPPKHLLQVFTPLLLVQFSQKQSGSSRHGGLIHLQHLFWLTANSFQPAVPDVQREVK